MGDQPITKADLEGTIVAFTTTLTSLTGHMPLLENQVNNANNNGNQQRYWGGEHVRVPCGGVNHHVVIAKNSSSEEEPYEEEAHYYKKYF